MANQDSEELYYVNGINGASGEYDFPALTLDQLSRLARGEMLDEEEIKELKDKDAQVKGTSPNVDFVSKEGADPKDLGQVGWGAIFAFADKDKTPAIREALRPLLEHRRAQAARDKEHYYKEYVGPAAYRPNESKNDFLARHGAGPGPADPEKVPYYLLIVGDPETIPYRFQYQLDVQYAVGRIYFDTVEEYAQYAHNVVLTEQQAPFLARRAAFFGVANPDDRATQLSAEKLIKPVVADLTEKKPDWEIKTFSPEQSTKAQLATLLSGGADTPALLFTASHGMGFPLDDSRQLKHQGALLCQDWPGPRAWKQPIPENFYFSGDDISSNANLLGLLAFFFACFGAGTPKLDEFAHRAGQREQIAPDAFLANLPRRMLAQGALAVVGHVERAWGTSFIWDKAGAQVEVFNSNFKRLMGGHPVGSAFEYFNGRYAEISTELSTLLEEIHFGAVISPDKLAGTWTANNDARSYVVIGDPAVRMPVIAGGGPTLERPSLETVTMSVSAPQAEREPPMPAPTGPTPTPAPADESALIDYRLFPDLKQVQSSLQKTLETIGQKLADTMQDILQLEVHTYLAEDPDNPDAPRAEAVSIIKPDGDEEHKVAHREGEIDKELWAVHAGMLEQARHNRTEIIKTILSLFKS